MNTGLFINGKYITDGGLETTAIFHHDWDLPSSAAFILLQTPMGREFLTDYYNKYIDLAAKYNTHFVLETPTWRSNTDWGAKLGYDQAQLDDINRESVTFMRNLIPDWAETKSTQFIISGQIGPRGDGYAVDTMMTPEESGAYHLPQIKAFAAEGADVVTAFTINYIEEGIGIIHAAKQCSIPAIISFTVETDGRLPNGETLQDAITKTDAATDGYATHMMINCAHPTHFKELFTNKGDWKNRIGGYRGNASSKSHAQLNESPELDMGNKEQLAVEYKGLLNLLPGLKVLGGCCGTDESHLECICKEIDSGLLQGRTAVRPYRG